MTINEADSQPQAEPVVSSGPGVLLSQAREAKGWSQAEVARKLNLRLAVIESIDSDHHKAGVALTFLRGYVKAYAKVVGASEAEAVLLFDNMNTELLTTDMPMKSFSRKTKQQANDKWLKRISWLLFLGMLASLVYWWWNDTGLRLQERNGSSVSSYSSPSFDTDPDTILPELSADKNAEVSADNIDATEKNIAASVITESPSNETEPAAARELAQEEAARENAAPTVAAELEATTQPEVTEAPGNPRLLTLNFTDNCWIKVTDNSGKVLSEGLKTAQQTLALEGEPPFKLVLGAVKGVHLDYMNEAVDLSAFNTGRTARLTIPLN